MIDFQRLEYYLGTKEYYKEINLWFDHKLNKEIERIKYNKLDLKSDLIELKKIISKRNGQIDSEFLKNLNESYFLKFKYLINSIEKKNKKNIIYKENTIYFIYDNLKIERNYINSKFNIIYLG